MSGESIKRKLAEFSLEAFAQAEYFCWKADKQLWAADEEYELLKEHGKDLLALLMTEIHDTPGTYEVNKAMQIKELSPPKKTSETALERLARSSDKWRLHRDGEHAARKKRNELRFKSRAAQRYFDTIQSGLALKRAEMGRTVAQSG